MKHLMTNDLRLDETRGYRKPSPAGKVPRYEADEERVGNFVIIASAGTIFLKDRQKQLLDFLVVLLIRHLR